MTVIGLCTEMRIAQEHEGWPGCLSLSCPWNYTPSSVQACHAWQHKVVCREQVAEQNLHVFWGWRR